MLLPTVSLSVCQSVSLSVCQSVSLSWNKAPIWGVRPDFYYCQTVMCLLRWSALSDEWAGLSFKNCCWPLPAQSFSGPSPVGLATIFYSLRLETSLFVASYDSQGYGGGIRPRIHTGKCRLKVKVMLQPTVIRPVCLGVKRSSWIYDQIFITVRQLRFVDVGRSL
jgi:hypothetical protein